MASRLRAAALALALCAAGQGAWAELRICNETPELQSVALGYKGEADWVSRGWWNIAPGDCAIVVAEALTKRYYYYFADSPSGSFRGQNYFFCVDDRVFEITGDTDCAERGHERLSFREIDTGETATAYSLSLRAAKGAGSGAGAGVAAPGGGASAGGGLGTQLVSEAPAPVDLGVDMDSLTTGLAPGRHGEAMTVEGLFQGCELLNGRAICGFYAGGEKLVVFYGGPTPDDLLYALEEMPMNAPVEIEADAVEARAGAQIVVVRAVRPAPQGDRYARLRAALQGDWGAEGDARSEISVRGSEIYVRYDHKLKAVRQMELAERCPGGAGGGGAGTAPVLVQREEGARAAKCYQVEASAARLELREIGGDAVLRFRRP